MIKPITTELQCIACQQAHQWDYGVNYLASKLIQARPGHALLSKFVKIFFTQSPTGDPVHWLYRAINNGLSTHSIHSKAQKYEFSLLTVVMEGKSPIAVGPVHPSTLTLYFDVVPEK